jgi:hypothetical protein
MVNKMGDDVTTPDYSIKHKSERNCLHPGAASQPPRWLGAWGRVALPLTSESTENWRVRGTFTQAQGQANTKSLAFLGK